MDYFQRAVAAFEARRFLEADAALKMVPKPDSLADQQNWFELRLECARILRPTTWWHEQQEFLRWLSAHKTAEDLISYFATFVQVHPEQSIQVFHEFLCEAHYQRGEIAKACEHAEEHIAYLLRKRLTPRLLSASQKYSKIFPESMYFNFAHFQALLLTGNGEGALGQLKAVLKAAKHLSPSHRASLLSGLEEALSGTDEIAGDKFQLTHLLRLNTVLVRHQEMTKEDWKKVAELIIHDDSWFNLKLAIELAIATGDTELAKSIHDYMKTKRGYSFVKLTREDRYLKAYLLPAKAAAEAEVSNGWESLPTSAEQVVSVVSDVLLHENVTHDEDKLLELGMIKQLDMLAIHDSQVPDLIMSYRELGFNRVVQWLFNKFEATVRDKKTREKIFYLRVLHALELKEYSLGLSYLSEMLGSSEMDLESYKELKYIESSLYAGLGDTRNAKRSLEAVAKIDPNYRRTRERMSKFA